MGAEEHSRQSWQLQKVSYNRANLAGVGTERQSETQAIRLVKGQEPPAHKTQEAFVGFSGNLRALQSQQGLQPILGHTFSYLFEEAYLGCCVRRITHHQEGKKISQGLLLCSL